MECFFKIFKFELFIIIINGNILQDYNIRNIVDMCQLAICSYDIASIINRFLFLFSKNARGRHFLSASPKSLCGEAHTPLSFCDAWMHALKLLRVGNWYPSYTSLDKSPDFRFSFPTFNKITDWSREEYLRNSININDNNLHVSYCLYFHPHPYAR